MAVSVSDIKDSTLVIHTVLDDKASPAFEEGAKAADRFAEAAKRAAEAARRNSEEAAKLAPTTSAWDRLAAKNDDVTASTNRLAQARSALARAEVEGKAAAAGSISQQEQYDRVIAALVDRVRQMEEALARTTADAATRKAAQDAWNGSLREGAGAMGALAQVTRDYAQQSSSATGGFSAQRAAIDSVYRASKEYELQLTRIREAVRDGAIPAAAAIGIQERLTAAYNASNAPLTEHARSSKAASSAVRDFGIQSIDVFQQLGTGAPILTTLIQQGSQVAQVAVAMNVSFRTLAAGIGQGLLSALRAVLTPMGLMVTAAAAAAVAIGYLAVSAESADQAAVKLKASLSSVRSDYDAAAKAVDAAGKNIAHTTSTSLSDATAAAAKIAAVPGVAVSQIEGLTRMVSGLSMAMGTSVDAAAKLVTTAITDPVKAAEELASAGIRSLDSIAQAQIIHLTQTGRQAEAVKIVLASIGETAKTAEAQTTPLTEAMNHLSIAMHGTADGGESLGKSLGSFINQLAANFIDKIASMIESLDGLFRKMSQPVPTDNKSLGQLLFGEGVSQFLGRAAGQTGLPPVGSQGTSDASIAAAIQSAAQANGLSPQVLALLQRSENAGLVNGQWPTSATGRVGPMQLSQSTFAGILGQPQNFPTAIGATDINNPAQNVQAGAALFANLLHKYGDLTLAILAYHDGETKLDAVLAGQGSPSQDALDQARKIVAQAGGSSAFAERRLSSLARASSQQTAPAVDTGAAADTAYSKKLADDAVKAGDALNAQNKQVNELKESIKGLNIEREKANAAGDTELANRYTSAINVQSEKLKLATDRSLEFSRATENEAAILRTVGGAAQELLRKRQEMDSWDIAHQDLPLTRAERTKQLAEVQNKLTAEYQKTIGELTRNNDDLQAQAVALDVSAKSSTDAKIARQAYNDSLNYGEKGTKAQTEAEAGLAAQYQRTAEIADRIILTNERRQDANTLTYLRAEIETLGMDSQARETYLAHLQNELQVRERLKGSTEADIKAMIAEKSVITDAAQALQRQQATMSYVAGIAENAFSTIGNSITQAFVQGQGAAVNWGNVVKAVIAQVIQAALQLAVLNPILNELFGGTHRQTISDVLAIGGTGGLGEIGGLLQLGGAGSSLSEALGGPSLGSLFGFGGSGGSGGSLFGGLGSGIKSFLGTDIATGSVLDSSGAAINSAGQVVQGGLTYGGALGLAGSGLAGYGIGTTLGGFIAGNRQSGQQNSQIGAGIGAGVGLAFGPVGGLVGGAIGGIAGSLFGPQNASPFALTNIGISSEGLLQRGSSANQTTGSNANEVQSQLDAINNVLRVNGLTLQGSRGAGLGSIGSEPNNPTHAGTNFIGSNVGDLVNSLKLSSSDPHLQAFLQANGGAGFSDINTLNTVITTVRNFVAAVSGTDFADKIDQTLSRAEAIGAGAGSDLLKEVATFVTQTVPALTQSGGGIGSLATTIQGLINTYGPAIATAQQLGYKEQELTDAREKAIQTATKTATDALYQADVALDVRRANAQATTSDNPADAAAAKLLAFDAQANAERTSFAKNMTDVFGQSYAETEQYANQMAFLESTLQAERLALQKQGNLKMISETEAFLDLQKTVNPGLSVRAYNAAAQVSGDPQVRLNAALYAFDTQAAQERATFRKTLTDTYGDAFGQTTAFANETEALERALAYERYAIQKNGDDAILAQAKQAAATLVANQLGYYQQGQQLTVRIRSAQAQASGDAAQIASASLFAFDTQAAEQRAALSKQLVDTFGESFISTSNYADRMVQLEQTLQAERVAVQTQGNAQILAQTKQAQTTATSLISSVAQYVDTLSTSAQSALSPQSQYSLSASRFNAVSGAAAAGDYNSLQQLTAYADSFLNASRLVNGSGQQYALDFQRVVDALNAVSGLSPDSLTASILISETRTQTSTLVDALAELGTKLDYLNVQVKQGALTPARIAA